MGSNNCFSKSLLMSFLLNILLTHTWMLQTSNLAKLFSNTEVLTLADDQFIKYIWKAHNKLRGPAVAQEEEQSPANRTSPGYMSKRPWARHWTPRCLLMRPSVYEWLESM